MMHNEYIRTLHERKKVFRGRGHEPSAIMMHNEYIRTLHEINIPRRGAVG